MEEGGREGKGEREGECKDGEGRGGGVDLIILIYILCRTPLCSYFRRKLQPTRYTAVVIPMPAED